MTYQVSEHKHNELVLCMSKHHYETRDAQKGNTKVLKIIRMKFLMPYSQLVNANPDEISIFFKISGVVFVIFHFKTFFISSDSKSPKYQKA